MQTFDLSYYDDKIFEIEGLYSIEYKGYSMRPHRHEALEILYVEKGQCEVNFHNPSINSVTTVRILPNNFIIINAGFYHDLHVDDDVSCTLKTIELKTATPSLLSVPYMTLKHIFQQAFLFRTMLLEKRAYFVLCDTIRFANVMTEIIYLHTKYKWHLPSDKYMLMQIKISELLLKMDDCVPISGASNCGVLYIRKAQQIIREKLFDPELTPDSVAKDIGITKNYLMSLYQKHMDHTILNEIQSLRIEQACSKILNTNEPLIDIGFSCGFNTRQSFFSNFKKYTGVSPSEFRSQHTHISTYSYQTFHDDEL